MPLDRLWPSRAWIVPLAVALSGTPPVAVWSCEQVTDTSRSVRTESPINSRRSDDPSQPMPATRPSDTPRPPNILLILPDQMRGQAMGVAGNPDAQTPHLDRLAAQGVYLPYTFANTPVCSPARAILLTGQYAHRNGVIINDLRLRKEVVTLAEILGENGYQTGFVGKWHLDGGVRVPGFVPPGPRRQGFQFWAANECHHDHFDTWYFRDTPEATPIEGFEPDAWTGLAIEFMRASRDRPFFLEVAMGPPHNPYRAPEQWAKLYDPLALAMRPNWKEGTEYGSREDIAHYYGMISNIDHNIGRMLGTLDNLGIAEDTIVLVTSDHGDMLGSQGVALKRKPWEESIRVPGIIRFPRRLKAGQVNDALFSHVDVAPTLLGLAGFDVPEWMQGTDISKVVAGESDAQPEAVYFANYMPYEQNETRIDPWRAVRTSRYMYARWEDGPWLLYDLQSDPYELENLVGRPKYHKRQQELDQLLAQEMRRAGDRWQNNLREETILSDRPAVYSVEELADQSGTDTPTP